MLADVFASKGKEQAKILVAHDILKPVKSILQLHRGEGQLIETSSSHLMYKICNEK